MFLNYLSFMYYYETGRYIGGYSSVPPTLSSHSLTKQGEVITFSVLRGGKVRVGNKIRERQYARDQYSVLLSRGWTKV